jgi:hypothetical protein
MICLGGEREGGGRGGLGGCKADPCCSAPRRPAALPFVPQMLIHSAGSSGRGGGQRGPKKTSRPSRAQSPWRSSPRPKPAGEAHCRRCCRVHVRGCTMLLLRSVALHLVSAPSRCGFAASLGPSRFGHLLGCSPSRPKDMGRPGRVAAVARRSANKANQSPSQMARQSPSAPAVRLPDALGLDPIAAASWVSSRSEGEDDGDSLVAACPGGGHQVMISTPPQFCAAPFLHAGRS